MQEGEFGRTGIGGGESGTIIPSAVPTTSAAGHCEARLRLVNPPPSCSAACAMAMAPLSPTALHERSRAVSAPHCGSASDSGGAPGSSAALRLSRQQLDERVQQILSRHCGDTPRDQPAAKKPPPPPA